MRARASSALLMLLLLFGSAGAGEDNGRFAPRTVLAERSADGMMHILWTPGEGSADYHRVYGIDAAGALVLLEQTTSGGIEYVSEAPLGYARYGVSGVKDGAESPVTLATTASGLPCLEVRLPPDPYVAVCKLAHPPSKVQLPAVLGP